MKLILTVLPVAGKQHPLFNINIFPFKLAFQFVLFEYLSNKARLNARLQVSYTYI